jgi:ribonuclease HII
MSKPLDLTNQSIGTIKSLLSNLLVEEIPIYIEALKVDHRTACKKMALQLEKRIASDLNEAKRMHRIFEFEREAWDEGCIYVAGLDEAGRGPLVGSVVAAAVVLDPAFDWCGIDDSKKLSAEQRNHFYEKIIKHSISYGIGEATHEEIDSINILNATKLAMSRAIEAMQIKPDYLLIDAVKLADNSLRQLSLIKGDSRSASIAAASILAKVTRDRQMVALHQSHPHYEFAQHKGYGTDKHYEAIRKLGLLPEHRRSFLKGFF